MADGMGESDKFDNADSAGVLSSISGDAPSEFEAMPESMPPLDPNIAVVGSSISELFLNSKKQLASLLKALHVWVIEYLPEEDTLITFNEDMSVRWRAPQYLESLPKRSHVWEEDYDKIRALMRRESDDPIEVRIYGQDGRTRYVSFSYVSDAVGQGAGAFIGTMQDITRKKEYEHDLRSRAHRDSLTGLYNYTHGREKIDAYLSEKSPFVSCALLIVDIDFFKSANDTHGHPFGDVVLIALADTLRATFSEDDILIRVGGDEFIVFMRNIAHAEALSKVIELQAAVRARTFEEHDYSFACSIGVCFLPANTFGFTCDMLYADADWALYRSKKRGRDRYCFCDDLHRYETMQRVDESAGIDIDSRYLRNDVISSAFEIFERTADFTLAMQTLLKVVGLRMQLDRISVVRTDLKRHSAGRSYQWTAPGTQKVLAHSSSFTEDDFLVLFNSYDGNGTMVLNWDDDLSTYSEGARDLLLQGGTKTVLYAAMYRDGHYYGAISYVTCAEKRHWAPSQRAQIGELTRIIAAYMAKSQAMNYRNDMARSMSFDSLTGLVTFSAFREEVERLLVGNTTRRFLVAYTDFKNFRYLNRRYGYQEGDKVLKEFAAYVGNAVAGFDDVQFARVSGDQFVLFEPFDGTVDYLEQTDAFNKGFVESQIEKYPQVRSILSLRCGIYIADAACRSAAEAIDAANYARLHVRDDARLAVCLFDERLQSARSRETQIINGMTSALENDEFQVYLQPKYRLSDMEIIGAEALVRWIRPDGTMLMPSEFVPIYERTGRITELDHHIFEKVAEFLGKNNKLGRRQVPISINASILHAADVSTVQGYLDTLRKYDIEPCLTEIELAESATVKEHDAVVGLFLRLRDAGIGSSLDDFGSGYSALNSVLDIPVDVVKIDREFLMSCEATARGPFFLQQLVAMVKGLGYRVLCEGVEMQAQLDLVRECGCEEAQGYLLCEPLAISDYERLMYGE